jgi:Ca2+-binding RTX toxin-like protein
MAITAGKITAGDDNILADGANDIIDAGTGNDSLDGGAGNDILSGNLGNDLIAGGAGSDTLKGGDGNDVLDGGIENDALYGDAGDDIVYGGAGRDTLNGGAGNDYMFGGDDKDILYGGAGSDVLDGGADNDTLYDTDNATAYGALSTENDELVGGDGNDTFFGGYDTMLGGAGDDVFNVKNQGRIYGGVGNDTITVTNANTALGSVLDGGLGKDTLIGGAGNDVLFSGYGPDTLKGGGGNDSYVITFDDFVDTTVSGLYLPGPGVDKIDENAGGGTDTIYYIRDFSGDGRDDDVGLDGKELDPPTTNITFADFTVTMPDNIENGVLDDQIYVNNPNKLTYWVAWLTGNVMNNTITGSNLDDILDGDAGNDIINAGYGNDVIFAGQGSDTIDGGAGEDLIAATTSFSLLNPLVKNVEDIDLLDVAGAANATGNSANNILYGNNAVNKLDGGAGNDILDGWYYSDYYRPATDKNTGDDKMYGGTGNDTYRIDSATDLVDETHTSSGAVINSAVTTGGIDTVMFNGAVVVAEYGLTDGVENLTIVKNLIKVNGNALNNHIIGDSSINTLIGGYGDDYLDGGSGVDTFDGGYGDDTYVLSDLPEKITEKSGQGNDWVQSEKISLDLSTSAWGGNIENARLTGSTNNLNLNGNVVNNILIGNAGNNRLEGAGGNKDTLLGGLGDDVYVVDSTTDQLTEVGNQYDTTGKIKAGWVDTVQSSVNFSLTSDDYNNFENLTLTGTTATTATGNGNDNYLLGNDLANTLSGLDGNDTLDGAGGNDTLMGGAGNDTYLLSIDNDVVVEADKSGVDTLVVVKNSTGFLQNYIENLTLTASATIGMGNSADNVIIGNQGDNTLTGYSGVDTLVGGEGTDTLTGGLGADVLNLTESLPKSDKVIIGVGDSLATTMGADRVVKLGMLNDTLDLPGTVKVAANISTANGNDAGGFNSHTITNGIIKFDDVDSYTTPVPINAGNIGGVLDYLKLNITDGSTVAFQGTAPDPTTTTTTQVSSTWVFQDNGNNDTLVALIGVTTATSVSTGAFLSTAIHIA